MSFPTRPPPPPPRPRDARSPIILNMNGTTGNRNVAASSSSSDNPSTFHQNPSVPPQRQTFPPPPPPPPQQLSQHPPPPNHYNHIQHPAPTTKSVFPVAIAPPPPNFVTNPSIASNSLPFHPPPPPPPRLNVPNSVVLPPVPPPSHLHPPPPHPPLNGFRTNQGPPLQQQQQQQQHQQYQSLPGQSFPYHQPPLQNGPAISMDQSTGSRHGRYPDPPNNNNNNNHQMNGSARGTSYTARNYNHPSDKPKIDPTQIPRPPLFTRPQQQQETIGGALPTYYTRNSVDGNHNILQTSPPPSDARYAIVDNGNASPDLIRSSLYAVPANRSVWHQTGDVPWGVICTPFAVQSEDFIPRPRYLPPHADDDNHGTTIGVELWKDPWKDPQAVPVVGRASYSTLDSDGPPRCESCLAYINPFFDTNDGTCNLCGHKNRRLQSQMIGEPMQFGTVEYEVSGRYVTREEGPVQPISIYAIDLTCPDAAAYIPIIEQVGHDIYEHHQRQRQFAMAGPIPAPPRIGIVLVSCLGCIFRHYHPNDHHTRSSIVVVSDVTEQPFCPLPLSDWTYDLSSVEGRTAWQNYCREDVCRDVDDWRQQTAKYKSSSNHADGFELSCGGAAFQFLSDALAASGGRCTWISWRRPNYGIGMLPHRLGNQKLQEDDTACYTPIQLLSHISNSAEEAACNFYKNLASKSIKSCVSFDIVIHNRSGAPHRGLDIATLSELCNVTGGKLTWLTCSDWQESLKEELLRQVMSYRGHDAVFKIRCSEGVQVKSFLPSGGSLVETFAGASPELELSCLMPNTCIVVELEHRVGGIPKGRDNMYIQTALLYTTVSGKRRVRVSTLAIRTSTIVNEIYRAVDFNAVVSLLTRSAAQCIHQVTNDEKTSARNKARSTLYQKCANMLACYRQYTGASASPMGQLLLPEKMLLLPLYCMCLLKSPMLRPTNQRAIPGMQASTLSPTNDERAYFTYHISQAMPSFATLMVHPNVFSVGPYVMETEHDSTGEWQPPAEVGQWNGFVMIPQTIAPSIEFIADDGIYMVDDGLRVYLLVGRSIPEEIKNAIFHQHHRSTELIQRLEVLLHQMRVYASTTRGSESELRRTWAPMIPVLQHQNQSSLEADVFSLMVTDSNSGEKDYVDFLCSFHRRVRERIESMSQRIKS